MTQNSPVTGGLSFVIAISDNLPANVYRVFTTFRHIHWQRTVSVSSVVRFFWLQVLWAPTGIVNNHPPGTGQGHHRVAVNKVDCLILDQAS